VRLFAADGRWCGLCFHPQRLVSRLERRFEADTSATVPILLFSRGRLVTDPGDAGAPLLLAGADASGRDVFARLVVGARASLGIAFIAVLGAAGAGTDDRRRRRSTGRLGRYVADAPRRRHRRAPGESTWS
jgi:hypothetical protein